MAEQASQDKINLYNSLLKKQEKFKGEVIKLETLLEEKKKSLKTALDSLKDLGVDTSNIAAWKENLEKEIDTELAELELHLNSVEEALKNV